MQALLLQTWKVDRIVKIFDTEAEQLEESQRYGADKPGQGGEEQ